MKKVIICSPLILSFFSCSKNKFTIDVEMKNANGKTAYLQRMIDNELINIDSALIENNKAVFNVKINDNNDAYHLYIKGWRRALPFFADNQNVVIKGDFNAYNKIDVAASETQKILDEINRKLNQANDENIKLLITEYIRNHPDNQLAPYLLYRYKWAFNLNDLRANSNILSREVHNGYYNKLKEYISFLERTEVGKYTLILH